LEKDSDLSLKWIGVGGICGLLGIGAYLAAAFAPLPDILSYAAAFAFGPLVAVGSTGLYHCLAIERRGPLVQIAALFGIAGGFTVLIMLTTQQAIFGVMKTTIAGASDQVAADVYRKVSEGLNAVHLGIDVAWDVLISVAVILFGIAMLRHPKFGRVLGGLGILAGGLLLTFNLWYFPAPPASANSIDWGPLAALWFVAVFIQLLRAQIWARERVAGASTQN
jgi:hypothetical protein